jgi:hypothetical protein
MATLQFKPKQTTKKLLSILPDRAREVLISRYGLGKKIDKMTLDSIGKVYGITRERVRQIENYAITNIRKSDAYKAEKSTFAEVVNLLHTLGGIVVEDDFLGHIAKDKSLQNHIHFILVIGDVFKKRKEDSEFKHRWHVNEELAKNVETSLRKLYSGLSDQDLLVESEIVNKFLEHLEGVSEKYKNQEVVKRWLSLSRMVGKNAMGEWGVASSSNVKTKGMRDYAFLVIRKHGSPIHFKEVATQITQIFKKKAHVATTHNELIKDKDCTLGRRLYALKNGIWLVVRDVIKSILEKYIATKKKL